MLMATVILSLKFTARFIYLDFRHYFSMLINVFSGLVLGIDDRLS